jgi:hypothetical protein
MARSTFGGSIHDLVVTPDPTNADALVVAPNTVLPLRSTPGGSVLTDFLLWDGSAFTIVATQIESDGNGYIPIFQGPDGVTTLYDGDGAAMRALVTGGGGAGTVTTVNGVSPSSGNVALTQDNIGDGTNFKQYAAADKTKLAGIASGATANSTDAFLLARANHTGTLPVSALPTSVMLEADYAGGTAVRPDAVENGRRCHWVCSTTAVPPVVASGTAGRAASDIVDVAQ